LPGIDFVKIQEERDAFKAEHIVAPMIAKEKSEKV
jgi:hypothetical protein